MHKNIQNTDSLDRWRVGKIRFFRGFDLKKGKSRIYLAYRLQNGRIGSSPITPTISVFDYSEITHRMGV